MIKKGRDIMQKIYDFCLSSIIILILFLMVMSGLRRGGEDMAARIAPEILRFHVLANSNSPDDQALKLDVKDMLLENIRIGVSDSVSNPDKITRDHLLDFITGHQSDLEQFTTSYIAEKGYDYPVHIRLESCYFPQKTYGDMTFPAGTYEAVRVLIGEGKGENFWCVLYPALCYLDSTYAVIPDSSKETLKSLISEDDFLSLMSARHPSFSKQKTEQESSLPRLKIRFKVLEYIGESRKSQE